MYQLELGYARVGDHLLVLDFTVVNPQLGAGLRKGVASLRAHDCSLGLPVLVLFHGAIVGACGVELNWAQVDAV